MAPTDKNKYGHLLYDDQTLHRAKVIKFMQDLGFKLKEIKEIIDAPNHVIKEALEKRLQELEEETVRLDQVMKEAAERVKSLEQQ